MMKGNLQNGNANKSMHWIGNKTCTKGLYLDKYFDQLK